MESGRSPLRKDSTHTQSKMHHSCKTAGIEGNCVVHVGNLDWHVPIEDVRQSLMSFLAQLLLSEAIRDIEVAEFPLKGIRKKRDQGKIHQGHAFLRCFTEVCEKAALNQVLFGGKFEGAKKTSTDCWIRGM